MKLLFIISLVASTVRVVAQTASADPEARQLYESALEQLSALPGVFSGRNPVYTHDNLHRGISVPQYDTDAQDYVKKTGEIGPRIPYEEALATLSSASDKGSLDAAAALAEIYTYGNFSVPVNYTLAMSYYRSVVAKRADPKAHFMLGFMYSTGLFGELSVDKQRAKIHYELAARGGNTNAILVLANQYLNGVDSSGNCEMAQLYYSRLARQVIQHLDDSGTDIRDELLSYNINVADFAGGLFGNKISESDSSVVTDTDAFVKLRDSLREKNLDSPGSSILDYYFDAMEHFHGGYFGPKNATKAFSDALACAYSGKSEFAPDRSQNPSNIDKFIWMRCQGLLGRMYLNGEGVERDVSRAHFWLSEAIKVKPDKDNLLDMALLRKLDPTTGALSDSCKGYLQDAAKNGSSHGTFLYAKSLVAPRNVFETTYVDSTYDLVRASAYSGHYQATFYFADAVEAGFSAKKGEFFTCAELSSFYKSFVERSESMLLPHLSYAFEQLRFGNYKNALLGYSIAAEQGLLYSQISAASLLHPPERLFSVEQRTFFPERAEAALTYLDLASSQGHIDSTIMLGDFYSRGVPGSIPPDHNKAFAYYSTAASSASAHACYKLGYMYEYGLGCANNSADYFMAKRYYDLSVKYYQDHNLMSLNSGAKPNTYAIGFALLRLRLKYVFSRSETRDSESLGWLGTLKKLAKSTETEIEEEKAVAKAQAEAEGGSYNEQEDYQLFDYIVLIFTLAFFAYVGFQNLRGQFRRAGQRANQVNADHAEAPVQPRFQFEFFFAI